MMKKIGLLLLLLAVGQSTWANETGKYKVQKGETLYGVALQHRTTIAELKRLNPQIVGTSIHIGEVLTVPLLPAPSPEKIDTTASLTPTEAIQITVSDQIASKKEGFTSKKTLIATAKEKETPVSTALKETIAQEVKVSQTEAKKPIMKGTEIPMPTPTDTIKKLGLTDTVPLSKLKPIKHIVVSGENLFALARYYDQSLNDLKKWNNFSSLDIKPGQEVVVMWLLPSGEATSTPKKMSKAELINDHRGQFMQMRNDSTGNYKLYREEGIGDWFDDAGSGGLYCFHRTAPIQTVIKITNPQNGKTEFVKVVQKLPDNVTTEDIGIRFNSTVAKRLGLGDQQRSRLAWQYYLPRKKK